MDRLILTDAQWDKIERHCLGKKAGGPGGRTVIHRGGALDHAHGKSLARSATRVRALEHGVQAVPSLG